MGRGQRRKGGTTASGRVVRSAVPEELSRIDQALLLSIASRTILRYWEVSCQTARPTIVALRKVDSFFFFGWPHLVTLLLFCIVKKR